MLLIAVICNMPMREEDNLSMTEINWRQVMLGDRELIRGFYQEEQPSRCEFTFGNNFLWSPHYHYRFGIVNEMLVFRSCEKTCTFSFPMGDRDPVHLRSTIDYLSDYEHENGRRLKFHSVSEEQFHLLDTWYPDRFTIEYIRDQSDYVYESKSLITLEGRKLHAKRNHINRFTQEHPDWSYESIGEENRQECIAMAEEWGRLNHCEESPEKATELEVTMNALKWMDELEMRGGLLRCNGRVIAFSIGEEASRDFFVVHIEKAFADMNGAYPMINQQFVLHEASGYPYINREDDTGSEGLRRAKLSYNPAFLLEKGRVTEK